MSNPAVINLAETETDIGFFRIEDNIGESIHLHLGDFRYDLTIKEFLSLSDDLKNVIDGFIHQIIQWSFCPDGGERCLI